MADTTHVITRTLDRTIFVQVSVTSNEHGLTMYCKNEKKHVDIHMSFEDAKKLALVLREHVLAESKQER